MLWFGQNCTHLYVKWDVMDINMGGGHCVGSEGGYMHLQGTESIVYRLSKHA
jgi:hypothetical protein